MEILKKVLKKCFFLPVYIFSGILLCPAQKKNDSREIISEIEKLSKEKDIKAVNLLINKNTYLEPEYVFKVISANLDEARKNHRKELADTYLTFGNFWFTQGNKAKSYDNYLKAEIEGKKIKDFKTVGLAMMNRSNIVSNRKEKIEMLTEAIKIFEEVKDTLNLAKAHLNTGNDYSQYVIRKSDSGKIFSPAEINVQKEKIFRHYSVAEMLNKNKKSPEIAASVNVHFGEWYKFEKKYPEAISAFKKSEAFFEQAGRTKGKVYCLLQLAKIEMEKGNLTSALSFLDRASEISKKFDYTDYLTEIYQHYITVYKRSGNTEKSLELYELYHQSAMKLNEISSRDKIMSIHIENMLAENEYLLEKSENQKKFFMIFSVVSLIILTLITGIYFLAMQNKKRKIESIEKSRIITEVKLENQKLQEELLKEKVQFGQEHLIQFANQVNRIDEFLSGFQKQMRDASFFTNQEKINAIKLSFSEITESQNDLKKISSMSSELNQDFFLHLRKSCYEITKKDEQLLSFLILEKSSKEIGKILNISTESVHTKRYRLRKKLNMGSEETFIDFYKRIISIL